MKKNYILLILLLALAGIAYFVFFKNNEGLPKESFIQIEDTAKVGRIFMADMQGRKIDLQKTKQSWTLNGGLTPQMNALENLLVALKYQSAMHPVPETQHNNIVKDMSANSTKVEVYDLSGNKILCFFVGGDNGETHTTYMMKEGAKRPYSYKLPGLDGYLSATYFLKQDDWKTKLVLSYKPNQIKKVELVYNLFPQYSFWIEQNNGVLKSSVPNFNNTKASDYLRFFENVFCMGFENGVTSFDTLKNKLDKMCDIKITDINNNTSELQLFYTPPSKRTKGTTVIKGKEYDLDILYGYDGKNIMTFITDNLRRILVLNKDFE